MNIKKDEKGQSIDYLSLQMSENLQSIGEAKFVLLDIYETAENFHIQAEIPGVNPDGLEIYISENNLVIKGVKDEKIKSRGNVNFLCMERSFGPFKRIISIPSAINSHEIVANCANGLLTISLKKRMERRKVSKRIKVNTNTD